MNIKSLLIGSAAALAAVSGAQAADAIVAAEPEPMEYVRVCDAFGTGFFYIPGTETCLKFGGYVRFQTGVSRGDNSGTAATNPSFNGRTSDWDSFTRAQFEIDTRSDTELGTLRGFIALRGDADNGSASTSGVAVNQAFIELGGLKVGKFYSEWDNDLNGETDILSTNALFNSIQYSFGTEAFKAAIAFDELEGLDKKVGQTDNNVGITGTVWATLGAVSGSLVGSYDTDNEEGAVRALVFAEVGPGTLGLSGAWSSGTNAYFNEAEWTVAAEYAVKATDRLTITPAAQYLSDYKQAAGIDAWTAGLTVDYKITDGLSTKVTANYIDVDGADDAVEGFFRLQRSF